MVRNYLKSFARLLENYMKSPEAKKIEAVANAASNYLWTSKNGLTIDEKYHGIVEDEIVQAMSIEEFQKFKQGDFSRMKEIFDRKLNKSFRKYKRKNK